MTLSQPISEVSEEPDFLLAALLFNQQEARRTDLQRLMGYGQCRNPSNPCKAPRKPEAVATQTSITFQWAECERCGYCDDGPE